MVCLVIIQIQEESITEGGIMGRSSARGHRHTQKVTQRVQGMALKIAMEENPRGGRAGRRTMVGMLGQLLQWSDQE